MQSPFIKEVASEIFRIQIPMPNEALKSINSYIVRGRERSLIIDTGLNRNQSYQVIQEGLSALGITPEKTDIFLTHMHGDHIGLVQRMWTPRCKVYLNRLEIQSVQEFFNFDSVITNMTQYYIKHGFPAENVNLMIERFHIEKDSIIRRSKLNYHPVDDEDQIEVGDRSFVCIHTPGHSDGHTCLYESKEKLLISGDHILGDITPGVMCVSDETNPLLAFLESMAKVEKLDVSLILPGHRRLVTNPQKRINEIALHHKGRIEEIIHHLQGRTMTAYEVASKIKWNLPYKIWEDIPNDQKWLATGEALAHLRYLEDLGKIQRTDDLYQVMFKCL
jgi:glyoxylase-like metal-dependent hydrolase (beta-lactamase superfamily II)